MATVGVTVEEFLNKGCGCKMGTNKENCLVNFERADVVRIRDSFLELNNSEKDMFVLSLFCQQKRPADEIQALHLMIEGKKICRNMFLFLLNISKEKLQNLSKHYNTHGQVSRRHGNCGKTPYNAHLFDTRYHVK